MVPSVRVEVTGRDAVVVHPEGEIDYSSLEPLRQALLDARIAGVREIVVDLREVTFLDSQGLAVILYAHQRQRSAGGRLILRNLNENAYRLLSVTNLTTVIDVDHGSQVASAHSPVAPAQGQPARTGQPTLAGQPRSRPGATRW
ncbi:STAS domain-containing protein [Frankia sp. EUN1f]|uniref:STAS domain-containing protein n=1 Tax=Parafrankia sp. EUN1f TaxID=102897 RepID=UPI0001C45673|nr:anti-sigma-factor antagonist [Parafrankia sp. EUN1f]